MTFLILARVVQGASGGALQPLTQAILLESFPPARRGMAMALFGVVIVVAPVIGPTLGGWLTDSYSWRWVFNINIPVGILAVFLMHRFVEDPPYITNARPGKIDGVRARVPDPLAGHAPGRSGQGPAGRLVLHRLDHMVRRDLRVLDAGVHFARDCARRSPWSISASSATATTRSERF